MTAIPTKPENFTVTSCDGKVTHAVKVLFRPSLRTPGLVVIGSETYRVTLVGSADDMVFEKPESAGQPGVVYECSAWGCQRGNFRCTCKDSQWKGHKGPCKHARTALALKEGVAVADVTVNDLLAMCWEQ